MKKFILGLMLSVCSVLLPIALLYFGLARMDTDLFIAAAVSAVIAFLSRKRIGSLLASGRQQVDYDEFGRSKRKGDFKNLTREEQDAIDLQRTADLERLLPQSVIAKITKKGSENPEADLDKMTGLLPVKQKVREMAARMEFEKKSKGKKSMGSMSGRHMVFYGSAGTGKTVTARIIAGFLYKNGYIRKNKVIEVDGNFLKAGAETAAKVKMITQYAYDGVLFIDEAYVLCEGAYGDEAVATLIKEMEDHRDRFICILAGYKKDMNRLLESNTGFKSRIKEYIEFPDYSVQEMKEIFISMAHEHNFAVASDCLQSLEVRLAKEKNLSTFGNGRTVRNILDEAIDRHALNLATKQIAEDDRYCLTSCDINTALTRNGII